MCIKPQCLRSVSFFGVKRPFLTSLIKGKEQDLEPVGRKSPRKRVDLEEAVSSHFCGRNRDCCRKHGAQVI